MHKYEEMLEKLNNISGDYKTPIVKEVIEMLKKNIIEEGISKKDTKSNKGKAILKFYKKCEKAGKYNQIFRKVHKYNKGYFLMDEYSIITMKDTNGIEEAENPLNIEKALLDNPVNTDMINIDNLNKFIKNKKALMKIDKLKYENVCYPIKIQEEKTTWVNAEKLKEIYDITGVTKIYTTRYENHPIEITENDMGENSGLLCPISKVSEDEMEKYKEIMEVA